MMKKSFLCITGFIFLCLCTQAQFTVVFKLKDYPLQHKNDSIFIAGDFNGWNPYNKIFGLSTTAETADSISIQLAAGNYQFKCTRGSWQKTECSVNGADVANHLLTINSDTTIVLTIAAWKDDFKPVEKVHTASNHVYIMDSAFFIPQLNRYRRIWIYLPEGYTSTKKHYPVLYMHDGQNLFDDYTSGFGEWGVDECLDSLIKKGVQACIVVGIDNGGEKRLSEYNPYKFTLKRQQLDSGQVFLPEGKEYINFITETLKPFIDKKYRTLTDKNNTLIAGSSMGGLISYYAMLVQPNVFGKAGIFSPAFWTAPAIKSLTDSIAQNTNGKFFFYAGGKEGEDFVNDMKDVQEMLGEKSGAMIYSVVDPEAAHNEKAWRQWFPEFYVWMLANGFNTVIKLND